MASTELGRFVTFIWLHWSCGHCFDPAHPHLVRSLAGSRAQGAALRAEHAADVLHASLVHLTPTASGRQGSEESLRCALAQTAVVAELAQILHVTVQGW